MAPLTSGADTVRAAVCSTTTCTPAIVTTLNDLLASQCSGTKLSASVPIKETVKPSTTSRGRARQATGKIPKGKADLENTRDGEGLSPREKFILATDVISATVKALTEAAKTVMSLRHKEPSQNSIKSSTRKTLRRSSSMTQTPLPRRSLERVMSSPSIQSKPSRSLSISSATPSEYRPTAECARIAFACLHALQASRTPGTELPPLQLENGMSVLIGKLITLGLDDMALKELRILKMRLDPTKSPPATKKGASTELPQTLVELLVFRKETMQGQTLPLVITTQLQVLKIMASSKKSLRADTLLQILQPSHPSSPTSAILQAAGTLKSDKASRQLQSLSDVLLSLCPKISPSEDAVALDPRLSLSPEVVIQLQTLAFHNRISWWKLAGHRADLAKELFDPFLRCLSAFARRGRGDISRCYRLSRTAFYELQTALSGSKDKPQGPKAILTCIYKLLGSLAQDANLIEEAVDWTRKVQALLDPTFSSDAKRCSIAAKLVGLHLRSSTRYPDEEDLLLQLLEDLEQPFKGESSEVDDLFLEVSGVRRAAITALARRSSTAAELSDGMREMCETLVLLVPRLSTRYLGMPPDSSALPKEILRHEQHRSFIRRPGINAIDSALYLVKTLINEERSSWELVDNKLQDCLILLERLGTDYPREAVKEDAVSPSYHVRISNLYFTQHLNMRRNSGTSKESQQIRALKRSIDSITSRTQDEKKAAYFVTKLERMADIWADSGRYDELLKTLLILRDESIHNGALKFIASAVSICSKDAAWNGNEHTILLDRTLQSLVKVQARCLNPTSQNILYEGSWVGEEQGVLLERYLSILANHSNISSTSMKLLVKVLQAALKLYNSREYPIRRLRVLSQALAMESLELDEILVGLLDELSPSCLRAISTTQCKDESLQTHLTHLRNLVTAQIELRREQPDIEIIKGCLIAWSRIREQCADLATLQGQVDDIRQFLLLLHSIADFMHLKGFGTLRVATLRLIADFSEFLEDPLSTNERLLCQTRLGSQWLELGYSGKAGLAMAKAEIYSNQPGSSPFASLQLFLSYSEYYLALGDLPKSEEYLVRAQAVHSELACRASEPSRSANGQQRDLESQHLSKAYSLYSKLALEHGLPHTALTHAKQTVRLLRRAWTITEQSCRHLTTINETSQAHTDRSPADTSLNTSSIAVSVDGLNSKSLCGSRFWALLRPLFEGLIHLSSIFAHHGMFQETLYYAEQAHCLVKEVQSGGLLTIASTYLGNIWLRAGGLDKGSMFLMEAKQLSIHLDKTQDQALLTFHLGKMQGLLGDRSAEILAYEEAESSLKTLSEATFIDELERLVDSADSLGMEMSKLTISKRKTTASRKLAVKPKSVSKLKIANSRAQTPIEPASSISGECTKLRKLRATIMRHRADALLLSNDRAGAFEVLEEAGNCVADHLGNIQNGLAMARCLLFESIEQMSADPVYSVLQESTISFPSVVGTPKSDKVIVEKSPLVKLSPPPKKGKTVKASLDLARSKSPAPGSFFDKLRQAQELLTEVHPVALQLAPIAVVHNISDLLNNIAILLSAAGQVKGKLLAHPGFTSCSIETAKTLALRRERKAIMADSQKKTSINESNWPKHASLECRRSSIGSANDMARFQRDFIDIIPKNWTAITVSLSDSQTELSITRLQAGHGPFVLRLPLGRNNSIDADEEVFGFEQGRTELLEIIELANESAHDARDMTGRQAKTAWWEEREALDARLHDLLENIEKIWLGGFIGMFSQQFRRPDLLARFQKSFHNILDKYLPSRQKTNKRNAGPRVVLDSRILELFIGLGDASDEGRDFSEPLTDLLYFVVDVLQFHGELNAYAEIDFDHIVIEIHDILRGYHAAVKTSMSSTEGCHTVLILDKTLQAFPWESLPCMEGLAVSRLPSLGCLRDRIVEQHDSVPEDAPYGKYINPDKGSYVLNPAGDLKATQTTFQKPLQSLRDWDSIVKREPSEAEMISALETKDLFLYFGHGSGAQYVRAREIRKLGRCAVTMLMGCSSGALTEAGEFEPYGPPINYMHAGCPTLVATLWDVTDKDIDRFAKRTFEQWGLFDNQVVAKGKGKTEAAVGRVKMSLVEAVAKGKEACNLRYLNAAAVCVFGIPAYIA